MWAYTATRDRVLKVRAPAADTASEDGTEAADDDSEPAQHTPGSDSAGEDFEFLDKSVENVARAKASGAQAGGKAQKRRNKKR